LACPLYVPFSTSNTLNISHSSKLNLSLTTATHFEVEANSYDEAYTKAQALVKDKFSFDECEIFNVFDVENGTYNGQAKG